MSDLPALESPAKGVSFFIGLGFFITVILGLIVAGFKLNLWLQDEQRAPVSNIVVSGDIRFIKKQQIADVIARRQPGSFFELDVELTHQLVEAMPWVYRASVRKRWPRGLEIYVVEQQPAAIWNGDMLLNEYGDVFNGQISDEQVKHALKLPTLFGPGGSEYTALQGYRNMQSLLDVTNLRIVEMFLSERFAWNIQLNNGVKLNLGRTEFIDRLQRFVDILPLISEQQKEVEYIDLRYDTGLAVGWKAQDKAA